jgi:hypothetical protein
MHQSVIKKIIVIKLPLSNKIHMFVLSREAVLYIENAMTDTSYCYFMLLCLFCRDLSR